eukprot:INCI14716.1.p1 GENE.INCI14716.1~~INCI14716.1.p1  ORF type:complete len:660 (-),score=115.52 INCI14716.1:2508-4487(-)
MVAGLKVGDRVTALVAKAKNAKYARKAAKAAGGSPAADWKTLTISGVVSAKSGHRTFLILFDGDSAATNVSARLLHREGGDNDRKTTMRATGHAEDGADAAAAAAAAVSDSVSDKSVQVAKKRPRSSPRQRKQKTGANKAGSQVPQGAEKNGGIALPTARTSAKAGAKVAKINPGDRVTTLARTVMGVAAAREAFPRTWKTVSLVGVVTARVGKRSTLVQWDKIAGPALKIGTRALTLLEQSVGGKSTESGTEESAAAMDSSAVAGTDSGADTEPEEDTRDAVSPANHVVVVDGATDHGADSTGVAVGSSNSDHGGQNVEIAASSHGTVGTVGANQRKSDDNRCSDSDSVCSVSEPSERRNSSEEDNDSESESSNIDSSEDRPDLFKHYRKHFIDCTINERSLWPDQQLKGLVEKIATLPAPSSALSSASASSPSPHDESPNSQSFSECRFATARREDALPLPHLAIESIGIIAFPLLPAQTDELLKKYARAGSEGGAVRSDSRLSPKVRSRVHELPPKDVSTSNYWLSCIEQLAQRNADALGVVDSSNVKVRLSNVFLFADGDSAADQSAKAKSRPGKEHEVTKACLWPNDEEKVFGSLVVQLPTTDGAKYAVVSRQKGRQKFAFREHASGCSYAVALFSNCSCKLRDVTSRGQPRLC